MITRTIGVLSAAAVTTALSIAPNAHATLTWVQQPGQALEIGVASNNMPWVVDINGYVQYGLPVLSCSGGLCANTGQVRWHILDGGATHIAVNLTNDVFVVGAGSHELWYPQGDQLPYPNEPEAPQADRDGLTPTNGNNWFNHFDQLRGIPTWQTANGPANGIGQLAAEAKLGLPGNNSSWVSMNFYSTFNSNLNVLTPGITQIDLDALDERPSSAIWRVFDPGDAVVALFSAGSGAAFAQNPWTIGAVNGVPDGHVYAFSNGGIVRPERPRVFTELPITYVTDHHVVAGGLVYRWTQGIDGKGTGNPLTDWEFVAGPTPGGPIAPIAFASVMPAPNAYGNSAVGPSHVWALDTAHNIYELEDIVNGVAK